jgi:hypothetical protein
VLLFESQSSGEKWRGRVTDFAMMSNLPVLLRIVWVLAIVVVGIVLALLPFFWIARRILSPIDQEAKFRQALVRFSIGDFLCLFLAIQIPLAGAHRFMKEETMLAYWAFTIVTWIIGPVIWFVGARTLSKAQVTTNSHRFVFLGLVMPLVYYGLVPFTALGISFLGPLVGKTDMPFRQLLAAWCVLAILFFLSGRFVQWMLKRAESTEPPISDREHEDELFRAAMFDNSAAGAVHGPHGEVRSTRTA